MVPPHLRGGASHARRHTAPPCNCAHLCGAPPHNSHHMRATPPHARRVGARHTYIVAAAQLGHRGAVCGGGPGPRAAAAARCVGVRGVARGRDKSRAHRSGSDGARSNHHGAARGFESGLDHASATAVRADGRGLQRRNAAHVPCCRPEARPPGASAARPHDAVIGVRCGGGGRHMSAARMHHACRTHPHSIRWFVLSALFRIAGSCNWLCWPV